MSIIQVSFILLTVVALSVGQILFRVAALGFGQSGATGLGQLLTIKLVVALIVYAAATAMWLAVLRTVPLRLAYPFVALAFVLVPVLAHVIFVNAG